VRKHRAAIWRIGVFSLAARLRRLARENKRRQRRQTTTPSPSLAVTPGFNIRRRHRASTRAASTAAVGWRQVGQQILPAPAILLLLAVLADA